MVMPRPKSIPDRWTEYKPVGEKVQGTRFIAFKVPLRSQISETVEACNRLDIDMLLKAVPNLGLIIDLTNTDRYYDPHYLKSKGVEHIKLKIPGHVTPPEHLVRMFNQYVQGYLKNNNHNDNLIGVHCTHGVNRAGFLICNYMISEMTINPDEAIKEFGVARGHSIERKNYLAALKQMGNTNRLKRHHVDDIEHDSPLKRRSISQSGERPTNFEERWNFQTQRQHSNNFKHVETGYNRAYESQRRNNSIKSRSWVASDRTDNSQRVHYNPFAMHDANSKTNFNVQWNNERPSTNITNWREREFVNKYDNRQRNSNFDSRNVSNWRDRQYAVQYDDRQRHFNDRGRYNWNRNSRNYTDNRFGNGTHVQRYGFHE